MKFAVVPCSPHLEPAEEATRVTKLLADLDKPGIELLVAKGLGCGVCTEAVRIV